MKTGHTPGPWVLDNRTDKRIGLKVRAPAIATASAPCPAVATIHTTPRSRYEARANGRLIAQAPDLLEVARLARAVLEEYRRKAGHKCLSTNCDCVWCQLGTVIAKAEWQEDQP